MLMCLIMWISNLIHKFHNARVRDFQNPFSIETHKHRSTSQAYWKCPVAITSCINLYSHTTPVSAQVEEWYLHKDLFNKTVRSLVQFPKYATSCYKSL